MSDSPDKTLQESFDAAMSPRENPAHPMFRDHNCSRCRSGKLPCAEGAPGRCSYPVARND